MNGGGNGGFTRMRTAVVILFMSSACRGPNAPIESRAPALADAGVEAATSPTRVVGGKARVIDTRDWSAAPAGSTIELVWYLRHARPPSPATDQDPFDPFMEEVPVELVMTLAGHAHRVSLSGNAAGPAFPRCELDDATIEFYFAGSSLSFAVERVPPNRAVIAQHSAHGDSVDSNDSSSSDRYVFDVPKDVHFQQRMIEVDVGGKETVVCP